MLSVQAVGVVARLNGVRRLVVAAGEGDEEANDDEEEDES